MFMEYAFLKHNTCLEFNEIWKQVVSLGSFSSVQLEHVFKEKH